MALRWEVRSARSQACFDTALLTSGIVPVNLMRLLTAPGSGVWDPWNGWKDIEKGKYRYIRNGFYADSSFYKSGRDLECFSALLYCQALLEAGVTDFADTEQPGIEDARAVLHDARSDHTRLALQEHAYLRTRLLYLMSAVMAAADTADQQTQLFKATELDLFLSFLGGVHDRMGQQLNLLREYPQKVLACSAWQGGDAFRLPPADERWLAGVDAATECQSALLRAEVALGEPQRVLLASPRLPLTEGVSPSSRDTGLTPPSPGGPEAVREFIHFKVPLSVDHWMLLHGKYEDRELAAVLALHAEGSPVGKESPPLATTFLPIPSVCSLRLSGAGANDLGHLSVRCNALGILESAPAICSSLNEKAVRPSLQVFILGLGDKPATAPVQTAEDTLAALGLMPKRPNRIGPGPPRLRRVPRFRRALEE